MPVNLTINDKPVTVPEGTTLLEAARMNGFEVPSLCYQQGLEPYCVCRVCTVEIGWPDGWRKLTAACSMQVKEGLLVWTDSEKARQVRKMMFELTLARTPDNPEIKKLAAAHGVSEARFEETVEPGDCILCGLCVEACDAVGAYALTFKNRGYQRLLSTPFDEPSATCVGCFACLHVCPTGHIKGEERDGKRFIWDREFPMQKCSQCGKTIITEAQAEHYAKQKGMEAGYFDLCDDCHRKEVAGRVNTILKW